MLLTKIPSTDKPPTENWPGYHTLRLTHLIMPFHSSHLSKLEQNVRMWNSHPPCISDGSSHSVSPKYTLMFYSSTDMKKRDKIVEMETRLQQLWASLDEPVKQCFHSWHIQHANLSANSDTYYRGTRLMLEKVLLGKVALSPDESTGGASGDVGYAFYMEPDCLPLRAHWLTALDLQCKWPQAPFWLKGSLYRGTNKGVYATRHPPQYYHLNGNAIINVQDRQFRSFYVKHYRPWAQSAAAVRERSFDTDFWRFLHNLDAIGVVKAHYHKFQYTDVVQNWWRSSYSVSKLRDDHNGTFLVHGGYPKP